MPFRLSPLPLAHTHGRLWISTWHLLCLRITSDEPKVDTFAASSCHLQRCLISHNSQVPPRLLERPWRGLFFLGGFSSAKGTKKNATLSVNACDKPTKLIFLRSCSTLWFFFKLGCRFCLGFFLCKIGLGNHIPTGSLIEGGSTSYAHGQTLQWHESFFL